MKEYYMAQTLRKNLDLRIKANLDLPPFLQEHVQQYLNHLNYPKLKLLEKNKDQLIKGLWEIKKEYESRLMQLFIYFLLKNGIISFAKSQKRVSRYFVMA